MEVDLTIKVKLFREFLDNGGSLGNPPSEFFIELLLVEEYANGDIIPETVSSLVMSEINAVVSMHYFEPLVTNFHLGEYQSVLQKSIFFEQQNIESEDEIDSLFENFKDLKGHIFRGSNEAKYRLYSSLQRKWITEQYDAETGTFKNYLNSLVSQSRQSHNGVIPKYLNKIGIDPANDLAVLCFLQHHKCPTPLLDWSYNFFNALFFAIPNKIKEGKFEIDNYISVYYLDENFIKDTSIRSIIEENIFEYSPDIKERIIAIFQKRGLDESAFNKMISDEDLGRITHMQRGKQIMKSMTKIDKLLEIPLTYFSDNVNNSFIRFYLHNNLNIATQEGLFTWNNDPVLPLEHLAEKELRKEDQLSHYKFSKCLNINKNLVPYIKRKLKRIGVTKSFIYPNSYTISNNIDKTLTKQWNKNS